MVHVYHDFNIDLSRPEYPQLIRMHDGGSGLHNRLRLHLFSNGMPENISGDSFLLHWEKGDGAAGECSVEDVVCDGHKVTFELPQELLTGCPAVTLWLHIAQDSRILHTFPLRLYVTQNI